MKQLTFFPVEKFGWVTISAYFEVKSADNPIWRYILKGVTSTLEFPVGLSSSFFLVCFFFDERIYRYLWQLKYGLSK